MNLLKRIRNLLVDKTAPKKLKSMVYFTWNWHDIYHTGEFNVCQYEICINARESEQYLKSEGLWEVV